MGYDEFVEGVAAIGRELFKPKPGAPPLGLESQLESMMEKHVILKLRDIVEGARLRG